MTFLASITNVLPDGMAVLANLDLNGFLTSSTFLTRLAAAISAFLLSLLNLLIGGGASTAPIF